MRASTLYVVSGFACLSFGYAFPRHSIPALAYQLEHLRTKRDTVVPAVDGDQDGISAGNDTSFYEPVTQEPVPSCKRGSEESSCPTPKTLPAWYNPTTGQQIAYRSLSFWAWQDIWNEALEAGNKLKADMGESIYFACLEPIKPTANH